MGRPGRNRGERTEMAATPTRRTAPTVVDRLCIDGEHVEGHGTPIAVLDPATEEEVARIPSATPRQVEDAAAAARRAADGGPWPLLSPAERSAALHRFADAFEARMPELIATVVTEVGT